MLPLALEQFKQSENHQSSITTAMILAAGRGERMRPLTDKTPKPMLEVGGKRLIEWHLHKLVAAGIKRVVINLHWLGEQISDYFGDGSQWGLTILYSTESPVLETAGGIAKALPLLKTQQAPGFLLVNGDVWSDIDYATLLGLDKHLSESNQAILAMVDNPEHHPDGDFYFMQGQDALPRFMSQLIPQLSCSVPSPVPSPPPSPQVSPLNQQSTAIVDQMSVQNIKYTYSGVGLYHFDLFASLAQQASKNGAIPATALGPILRTAMQNELVTGVYHQGFWSDVGTPERLAALERYLTQA